MLEKCFLVDILQNNKLWEFSKLHLELKYYQHCLNLISDITPMFWFRRIVGTFEN